VVGDLGVHRGLDGLLDHPRQQTAVTGQLQPLSLRPLDDLSDLGVDPATQGSRRPSRPLPRL